MILVSAALLALTPLAATPAFAAPPLIRIDATVDDDLEVITGTLTYTGDQPVYVVDPLAKLPAPSDDRTTLRTWTGAAERGVVRAVPTGTGQWRFTTILPRRWGDVGAQPGRALFANGQWYPQPMLEDEPIDALWTVSITLPQGVAGAVGDVAGTERIAWFGMGERVSLAVLRGGRVTSLEEDGMRVDLLTRRRPPRAWRRRILPALRAIRPPEQPLRLAIVRAPLRRRLARPGRGLAYLSDRAWRLTPGLRRYHDPAIQRALLTAALEIQDPVARDIAAATLVRYQPDGEASARKLLRWVSWNPVIDAILHDRTLPFWSDILDTTHPADPLRDDLLERYAPRGPATAHLAQIDALHGRDTAVAFTNSLLGGASMDEAAAASGVRLELVDGWRAPPVEQDLHLHIDRDALEVRVERTAPDGAPPEVVVLRVDDERAVRVLGRGERELTFGLDERPRRVVLDPDHIIDQTSRRGDAWPPRFTVTAAAWVDQVNLTEGWLSGFASVWARGSDDTRNVWSVGASANQQTLPSLSIGWLHRRGPLQDGLNRPHRLSAWIEPAWTHPRFAEGDRALFTLGAGAGYAWDTRISGRFPLRGRRLAISANGGVLPSLDTHWSTARLSATGLVSPHPRLAFAGTASLAGATGDAAQRLLWLGGPGSIVSLPPAAAIGRARTVGRAEARWAPIRHASVPLLGLAWLSEVQLTGGVESAYAYTLAEDHVGVVGLTGGATVVVDLLGASPALFGTTVGYPVRTWNLDAPGRPQITLRFGQAF